MHADTIIMHPQFLTIVCIRALARFIDWLPKVILSKHVRFNSLAISRMQQAQQYNSWWAKSKRIIALNPEGS